MLPVVAMGELEPIKIRRIATYTGEGHFLAPLLAVPTRVCIASGTTGQGSASVLSASVRESGNRIHEALLG